MHIKGKDSWLKHLDFIVLDIVVLSVSFFFANLIYLKGLDIYPQRLFLEVYLCVVLPCLLIDIMHTPFSGILRRGTVTEVIKAAQYVAFDYVFSAVLMYLLKIGGLFSRFTILITYFVYLLLIIVCRVIWKMLIISGRVSFVHNEMRSLLVVSSKEKIISFLDNINKDKYKQYDISGLCIVDDDMIGEMIAGYKVLCTIEALHQCVIENNIQEVFIAEKTDVLSAETAKKLIEEGVGIHLAIREIYGFSVDEQSVERIGIYKTLGIGLYNFTVNQSLYLIVKRAIDLVISLLAMVPFCVLIILVKTAFILSGDYKSIFFLQERVGKDGMLFKLYKFRTMVYDAENALEALLKDEDARKEWDEYHKLKNDPRITKVGKFLRTTSLDEVPQFINVLKGEMSIIGPRPLVEGELKMHNGLKLYERVKPGITGWWACNGRSNISYEERLDMEYYYIKNCSLLLDILTFFRTIYVVLKKSGAE